MVSITLRTKIHFKVYLIVFLENIFMIKKIDLKKNKYNNPFSVVKILHAPNLKTPLYIALATFFSPDIFSLETFEKEEFRQFLEVNG